jgi:hypothetical protein
VLVPEDPSKWNNSQSYLRGWGDGRNPFIIRGVPAGEYLLFAVSNVGIDGEVSVKKYLSAAIKIEVRAGMVETVQVTPLKVGN